MSVIKKKFKCITIDIRKALNKDFPDPGVLDKDERTPGDFVLNTPEVEKHLSDAEAANRVLAGELDEYLPKPDNDNYAWDAEKREKIANAWRKEADNRDHYLKRKNNGPKFSTISVPKH